MDTELCICSHTRPPWTLPLSLIERFVTLRWQICGPLRGNRPFLHGATCYTSSSKQATHMEAVVCVPNRDSFRESKRVLK